MQTYEVVDTPESNRREQFRIVPQDERHKQVRLIVGRQKISCELINESTGGFMVALNKRTKISPNDAMELHLYNRAAPVQLLWSRIEDGRQMLGLERTAEHSPGSFKHKGGAVLLAAAIVVAFVAGYVLKHDAGVRQLMLRHNLMRTTSTK